MYMLLLQECDIRYLVETIWRGQSALSSERDLSELCLVRWEAGHQWSPWNTILLTREEAQAHTRIDKVEEVSEREGWWELGGEGGGRDGGS